MIRRRLLLEEHRLTEHEQKSSELLELIRRRGPLTRTELSRGSGFNIVTVSNYVSDFIKKGFVVELGFDVSTGGRKPVLVELDAKAGFAIGIDGGPMDVSGIQLVGLMTDLRGAVIHRLVKSRSVESLDQVMQLANALVQELLASSPVDRKHIQGIGVGLPGILDERAGTIRDVSRHGIRANYLAVRDQWEAELKLPVLIGNHAALGGYGELCLGLNRPVKNMLYLYSDVGASLILGGHIYWGSGGSAGALGLHVPSEDDYLAWIKSPKFVTSNAWDLGLPDQAEKLIEEGHATKIRDLVKEHDGAQTLGLMIQAAQEGDALARELLEHAAMQIGIRVASLVNLLNPEIVVIGGGIEKAGSLLLDPVWRAVKRYAHEEPASLVDILPGTLGENAVALGAACWVIREVFIQA